MAERCGNYDSDYGNSVFSDSVVYNQVHRTYNLIRVCAWYLHSTIRTKHVAPYFLSLTDYRPHVSKQSEIVFFEADF